MSVQSGALSLRIDIFLTSGRGLAGDKVGEPLSGRMTGSRMLLRKLNGLHRRSHKINKTLMYPHRPSCSIKITWLN